MPTRQNYLIAMLLSAAFFVGCSPSDGPTERSLEEAQKRAERERATVEAATDSLAKRSDAVVDWRNELGSLDIFASNRVYTVDVERVWIGPRPILFLGVLDDVAPHDQLNYHLFVRDREVFWPEVRLHLTCPKDVVTPILLAVKEDEDSIYPGAIAVTAQIIQVEHEMLFHSEESTKHVFVGHGQCVDIIYVGDALDVH